MESESNLYHAGGWRWGYLSVRKVFPMGTIRCRYDATLRCQLKLHDVGGTGLEQGGKI